MSDNDWFDSPNWHDAHEAVDPGGAAAGPGAIGPVPAQLISSTSSPGDYHYEIGDDGMWLYVPNEDPSDPGGAAAGPGASGGLAPISNATTEGGPASTPAGASGAPFQLNYSELEKFAEEHDLNAAELAEWASGDPDFAERYLATHGKVNFGTYLKIKEFMASKQIAGAAFAEHNTQTSNALRFSIASTKAQEEANARAIDATRMV
ncbi:hypothetical protein H7J06_03530 [Mycobacterium hodleri]|uniref:type VII secretion target n=1 Tax=Mycolicibacterium hodleri TaxID=49897 RepID=UPI0021F38A78|nr:type VII secretion target [Mycolicibacterium hodleri]MCV7132044.1 hypothetical protein [Mycolicibacterium hodleri]